MTENGKSGGAFLTRLRNFRRAWKRGLLLALCLRLGSWSLAAFAVYFFADYFLALGETVRMGLNVLIPIGLAAAMTPEALRIARLGLDDTAATIDRRAQHHRKTVLTAWELLDSASQSETAKESLPDFFLQRNVDEAAKLLSKLTPGILRPRELLATRIRQFAGRAAAALLLAFVCGSEALHTVATRLVFPGRDTPPFSHCRFSVTPDAPTVVYGGSADVSVAVTGAPAEAQVWLLTRQGRKNIQRSACFQDGNGRYGQRLENVTRPISFCFAVGRARSRWHAVEVQLQPHVLSAHLRVEPPAYTRLPPREFLAGQEDLAGVWDTRVSLSLTSNRPLRDGTLTLKHGSAEERVIEGRLTSERTVLFAWSLRDDAEVQATVRDLQGTPTAHPVVLHQKRLPDEAPKVRLIEPPAYSLATPTATLRVSGQAEDDFGLSRLDWVRTVAGFNDCALTLGSGALGAHTEFEKTLDLGTLGVQPGQTLEFYLEALDTNPSLPGVGASGVSKVKIISEAEYAEMLRDRETLDDFLGRFEAASQSVNQIIASLEETKQALSEPAAPAAAEARLKRLVVEHMAAEALFQQLAREFSVYDAEYALAQASASVQGKLGEDRLELEDLMRAQGRNGATVIDGMIRRLKGDADSLDEQKRSAQYLVLLSKVMDCAARYQALVQRQSDLVRRLKQHFGEKVASQDLPFLGGYGEEQSDIERGLAAFARDTAAAAETLPDSDKKLKNDVLSFLEGLQRCGAGDAMGQAVVASRNTDAAQTLRNATRALERLESLLRPDACGGDNVFGGMCRGQQPNFGPDAQKKTLQDMFRALCRKRGVGRGSGAGAGGGGMLEGSSGYSELGVPVYGPGRSSLNRSGEGQGKEGKTGRGEPRAGALTQPSVEERVRRADSQKTSGEAIPFERLPAKYREAVKRYFQNETEGGGK